MDFIERRAEAANDLVFGRIGEKSKSGRKYPRWPSNIASCPKWVMTMATQVGLSGSENSPTSNQISIRTLQHRRVLVRNATVVTLRTG